jgi:hypothetical protein
MIMGLALISQKNLSGFLVFRPNELIGEGEIFNLRASLAINASSSLCCVDSAGGCRIACQ